MKSLLWYAEKKKEFYKNAKLISKYKRTKKQQSQSNNPPEFPIREVILTLFETKSAFSDRS